MEVHSDRSALMIFVDSQIPPEKTVEEGDNVAADTGKSFFPTWGAARWGFFESSNTFTVTMNLHSKISVDVGLVTYIYGRCKTNYSNPNLIQSPGVYHRAVVSLQWTYDWVKQSQKIMAVFFKYERNTKHLRSARYAKLEEALLNFNLCTDHVLKRVWIFHEDIPGCKALKTRNWMVLNLNNHKHNTSDEHID